MKNIQLLLSLGSIFVIHGIHASEPSAEQKALDIAIAQRLMQAAQNGTFDATLQQITAEQSRRQSQVAEQRAQEERQREIERQRQQEEAKRLETLKQEEIARRQQEQQEETESDPFWNTEADGHSCGGRFASDEEYRLAALSPYGNRYS
jgi:colicin import membrane protein